MKLEEKDFEMPGIIFEKVIDKEDAEKIISIFKNWCKDELTKRECKFGKLFTFNICDKENHFSLRFGNKKKYLEVSNGFMPGSSPFEAEKINDIYHKIVNETKSFIEIFVKENNLTLEVIPTGGISNDYIISRKK